MKELTPAEIEIMRQARQAVAMGGRAAELMNLARFADDNGLRACGRALRNIAGAFADKENEVRKQNRCISPDAKVKGKIDVASESKLVDTNNRSGVSEPTGRDK